MIKVVIIDDEPLAAEIVEDFLESYPEIKVLQICHDGFDGLKAIKNHEPDLIFLDVQMPKISGFEMLELLEVQPAVIFTTAFDEYAMRAFDAHAVDYLLKPFSKVRFEQALEKFMKMRDSNTPLGRVSEDLATPVERIVLKDRGEIKIVPYSNVRYFEANDDYVNIYTADGKFLKNKTMKFFEKHLPPTQFVRVHRSYIVNVTEITKIEPYEKDGYVLLLKSGAKVPVSKTGYPKLKMVLGL
ncbi:LytTR family transcriptional regulator DNA-binding domain-containing protein [Belliella sp. DSM 111904]|uniref:LytTR family transcriptional regulator DNA-binding domain-containing protein n=1 Tax=Belliella filtrata TaxID=2923435 RepID=A0ABS9UYI1_9BACT|nr:LytTR family transcriptional regulator DNA-binding domain-containing protein [Belliella filtrata]MCH7409138.1 LytTR family transcriptional regulator DNA-binding domain-containing protein [Belliella filtrata]